MSTLGGPTGQETPENNKNVHEPSVEAIEAVAKVILRGKQIKNIDALIVQKAICQLLREEKVVATIEHPKGKTEKGTTDINLQTKNRDSYLAQVESGNWKIVSYNILGNQSSESKNLPQVETAQFTPEDLTDMIFSDFSGVLATGKFLAMSNYAEAAKKSGIDIKQVNLKIFQSFSYFLQKNNFPPLNIVIRNTITNTNSTMTKEIFLKILGDKMGNKNNRKDWEDYFASGVFEIVGFGINSEYIKNRNKSQQQPTPQLPQPNPQPTQSPESPESPTSPNLPEPKTEKEKAEKPYQHLGSWMTGVTITRDDKTGEAISSGFTGQYIQNSIGKLPQDVENSIRNRLFAVAEGAAKEGLNTVVGRMINGKNVVASINSIKDDRGRSASGYRYQMGQGGQMSDILPKIQTCSLENNGAGGDFPFAGENTNFELESLPNWQEIKNLIDNSRSDKPLILEYGNKYPISVVMKIAEKLAQKYKVDPSFAYHVRALEKPTEFLVIVPYDQKSQELINRNVESIKPVDNRDKFNPEINIKTVVNGLIIGSLETQNSQKRLEDNLNNLTKIIAEMEKEPKKYSEWESKLVGAGLEHGIKDKLIGLQYPKLVLLQLLTAPSIDFVQTKNYQDYFDALNKQVKSGWFKKENSEGKKEFLRFLDIYQNHFANNPKLQTRINKIKTLITK